MVIENTYKHNEKEHNTNAAAEIVPYLIDLFHPNSVIDIGFGIGTWLYQSRNSGITNIKGIDIPYVDKNLLPKYLKENEFEAIDLTKPFNLNQRFDLAVSLEVAEYLPESFAYEFIRSIVQHSDVVVFSAAIPYQEGQYHLKIV